jgi:Tfp pilus assembly protein PilV
MRCDGHSGTVEQGGFSLLEAMISVALIAVAMIGAFSVTKVLGQSKDLVDQKTDFQLASQSLNNNIALGLQDISLSDVINIPANQVVYTIGASCPAPSVIPIRNLLQSELCRVSFFQRSLPNATKTYRVQLTNVVEDAMATNKYLRITVSFFDSATSKLEFERVFLHVK